MTNVWDFYFDALLDLIEKKDSRLFEPGFSNRIVFDSDQLTQSDNERSTLFSIRRKQQDTLAPHLSLSPSANRFVELAMTQMRKRSLTPQKISTDQILNAYTLFHKALEEATQQIAGNEYKRRVEEIKTKGKQIFGEQFNNCLLASDKFFYQGNETVFSHLMEGLCSSSPYIDETVTSKKGNSFYRYPYARVFALLRGAIELYRNRYISNLQSSFSIISDDYAAAQMNLECVYEVISDLVEDTFQEFQTKLLTKLQNIDQTIVLLHFKNHCLSVLQKYVNASRAKTSSTVTAIWDNIGARNDREEIVIRFIDFIEASPNLEALAINLASLNMRNSLAQSDVGKSDTLDRLLNDPKQGLMVDAKKLCEQFKIELPQVQSRLSIA